MRPLFVVPLAIPLALVLMGAAPAPLDLMKKSDAQHRVKGERTKVTLSLQEKGGPERVRSLIMATQQDPALKEGDKQWIRFEAPGDVKGTQLLTLESSGGDVEQWLYLPAFKKTRRIGSAELGDRFANTDFSYEDLKRRRVEDYAYTLAAAPESVDGAECWVIDAAPSSEKAKKESPYGKSQLWLRKDNLFVVKMRHFDKTGRPLKELKAEGLVKVQGNAWRADKLTMIDVQRNHRTVVIVNAREVLAALPPTTFDPHTLSER
jgi:hypothetical protein